MYLIAILFPLIILILKLKDFPATFTKATDYFASGLVSFEQNLFLLCWLVDSFQRPPS